MENGDEKKGLPESLENKKDSNSSRRRSADLEEITEITKPLKENTDNGNEKSGGKVLLSVTFSETPEDKYKRMLRERNGGT